MQKKNTSNTKKLGLLGLVTVATLGATALANAETYTVQKGDTLSAIAKKDRKSTRLNSSHRLESRMPSSA